MKDKMEILIEIWLKTLVAIPVVIFMCHVCGCTHTAMKRTRTELIQECHRPNIVVNEYTSFVHREFLMRSKMTNAEAVVDGDYRHYSIESREQRPDPNTAGAVTEGAVRGIVGGEI